GCRRDQRRRSAVGGADRAAQSTIGQTARVYESGFVWDSGQQRRIQRHHVRKQRRIFGRAWVGRVHGPWQPERFSVANGTGSAGGVITFQGRWISASSVKPSFTGLMTLFTDSSSAWPCVSP